jgi:hypothetical protein
VGKKSGAHANPMTTVAVSLRKHMEHSPTWVDVSRALVPVHQQPMLAFPHVLPAAKLGLNFHVKLYDLLPKSGIAKSHRWFSSIRGTG